MDKTEKKRNKKAYQTFNTICIECDVSLKVVQFPVSIGHLSFALCPKHLEKMLEYIYGKYPRLM